MRWDSNAISSEYDDMMATAIRSGRGYPLRVDLSPAWRGFYICTVDKNRNFQQIGKDKQNPNSLEHVSLQLWAWQCGLLN